MFEPEKVEIPEEVPKSLGNISSILLFSIN